MSKTAVIVEFRILTPNMPADEITRVLKLEPDLTWNKGEVIGKSKLKRKQYGWVLSTGKRTDVHDLDVLILEILKRLKGAQSRLTQVHTKFKSEHVLACVIYSAESFPSVHLNPAILRELIKLDATLDIDLY